MSVIVSATASLTASASVDWVSLSGRRTFTVPYPSIVTLIFPASPLFVFVVHHRSDATFGVGLRARRLHDRERDQ